MPGHIANLVFTIKGSKDPENALIFDAANQTIPLGASAGKDFSEASTLYNAPASHFRIGFDPQANPIEGRLVSDSPLALQVDKFTSAGNYRPDIAAVLNNVFIETLEQGNFNLGADIALAMGDNSALASRLRNDLVKVTPTSEGIKIRIENEPSFNPVSIYSSSWRGDQFKVRWIDGEAHGQTPFTATVIPHAVAIVVP